ncbi:MAG: hypothetical protein LBD23_16190 [Oscillospiraceae bacterium]|jgi:hypothetical protein|nr:hypothetical protein [Oscillospiraceae bacterium]
MILNTNPMKECIIIHYYGKNGLLIFSFNDDFDEYKSLGKDYFALPGCSVFLEDLEDEIQKYINNNKKLHKYDEITLKRKDIVYIALYKGASLQFLFCLDNKFFAFNVELLNDPPVFTDMYGGNKTSLIINEISNRHLKKLYKNQRFPQYLEQTCMKNIKSKMTNKNHLTTKFSL